MYWDVHPQEQREPIHHPQVRWSPLPEDCYKANFDAAFFERSGSAGVGVVYRDHIGQVVQLCVRILARFSMLKWLKLWWLEG